MWEHAATQANVIGQAAPLASVPTDYDGKTRGNPTDIGADQYLAGIDLDSCMSSGTIAPWAAVILELLDSYAEISPSGSGLKLFCYIETVDAVIAFAVVPHG